MSIENLMCRAECEDLLHRFAYLLDSGSNSEAADLFTDEATLRRPDGEYSGPAIRALIEQRPATVVTRHILTNLSVTRMDARTATASAYCLVYRVDGRADDVLPREMPDGPTAAGDWKVDFRLTEGGWRMASWELLMKLARH